MEWIWIQHFTSKCFRWILDAITLMAQANLWRWTGFVWPRGCTRHINTHLDSARAFRASRTKHIVVYIYSCNPSANNSLTPTGIVSPFSVKPISSLIRFQRVKSTATQRISESPTRSWASASSDTLRSRSAIAPTDEEAAVQRAISLKFEFLFHYRDDSSWWGAVASRKTLLSCWSLTIRHICAASRQNSAA